MRKHYGIAKRINIFTALENQLWDNFMKVLVVYYSRTGNTKFVAEAIAQSLEADIEEIKDKKNRMGVFGFLRCGYEAIFKTLQAAGNA